MKARQARVAIVAAACGIVMAAPAAAIELDDVTVVTLAHDGSWGVARAGSTGEAIAAALRSCRAMSGMTGAPTDCGAQFVTTRGGWVVVDLCGDHQIIVSAATREGAEIAAIEHERKVRSLHVLDLPPCRRVLTVEPGGAIAAGEARHTGRAKAERPFR